MPKRAKLNHEPFEHYSNEPKDHSNFYVGIAIGVILTFCAAIWYVTSVMEAVII